MNHVYIRTPDQTSRPYNQEFMAEAFTPFSSYPISCFPFPIKSS